MGAELSTTIDSAWPGEDTKTINQIGELIPSLISAGNEKYNNPEILKSILALEITKPMITKADFKAFALERFADVESEKLGETTAQIEFYMGNKNLEVDKFFHQKICEAQSHGGYISIEFLCKCKKLMGITKSIPTILEAIQASQEVEGEALTFRRKDNAPVPELLAEGQAKPKVVEPQSLLYKVTTTAEEVKTNWKEIRDAFETAYPDITIEYTRFQGNEGTIGVNGMTPDAKLSEISTITVNDIEFSVERLEEQELIQFFKDHGSHFDLCRKGRKDAARKTRKNMLNLGGIEFRNSKKILTYLKAVQMQTTNGAEVETKYIRVLTDVLKHHPNWSPKFSQYDIKGFAVDKHPEYPETRCFFVIKTDDTREDFSLNKCLGNIK